MERVGWQKEAEHRAHCMSPRLPGAGAHSHLSPLLIPKPEAPDWDLGPQMIYLLCITLGNTHCEVSGQMPTRKRFISPVENVGRDFPPSLL